MGVLENMFLPCMDESHQYAVALSVGPGRVGLLRSYPTKDSLIEGYKAFNNYAIAHKISRPIPVEFMQSDGGKYNQKGTVTILTKLMEEIGREENRDNN